MKWDLERQFNPSHFWLIYVNNMVSSSSSSSSSGSYSSSCSSSCSSGSSSSSSSCSSSCSNILVFLSLMERRIIEYKNILTIIMYFAGARISMYKRHNITYI